MPSLFMFLVAGKFQRWEPVDCMIGCHFKNLKSLIEELIFGHKLSQSK